MYLELSSGGGVGKNVDPENERSPGRGSFRRGPGGAVSSVYWTVILVRVPTAT